MFCKHSWKLLDKTILPSAFEQLTLTKVTDFDGRVGFEKKLVLIFCCEKCGKINKTIEYN